MTYNASYASYLCKFALRGKDNTEIGKLIPFSQHGYNGLFIYEENSVSDFAGKANHCNARCDHYNTIHRRSGKTEGGEDADIDKCHA